MVSLDEFIEYVKLTCSPGSNLPGSYIRALRYVNELIKTHIPEYSSLSPVWEIESLDDIEKLYAFLKAEEKRGSMSVFAASKLPQSYFRQRYCTSALKTLGRLLAMRQREQAAIGFYNATDDAQKVAQGVESLPLPKPRLYLDDDVGLSSREGRETLRQVKQRQNQDIFRRMVLMNYGGVCCVTGLPVKEALRASHIVGWAEDEKARMLPTNGLCLAATYDAVFDRHLISFDEDCRMVLAPSLKEYFTNEVFVRTFKDYEGRKLLPALKFQPSQEFLQRHREQMR